MHLTAHTPPPAALATPTPKHPHSPFIAAQASYLMPPTRNSYIAYPLQHTPHTQQLPTYFPEKPKANSPAPAVNSCWHGLPHYSFRPPFHLP